MKIHIKLWGQLRETAGQECFTLECEAGISLRQLIQAFSATSTEALAGILKADNQSRSALIFINDNQVFLDDEINLSDGSCITLMSPIAGG